MSSKLLTPTSDRKEARDERTVTGTIRLGGRPPAVSIAGGTDEIQRNILVDNILSLPGEPGPPATFLFRDIPRNELFRTVSGSVEELLDGDRHVGAKTCADIEPFCLDCLGSEPASRLRRAGHQRCRRTHRDMHRPQPGFAGQL